jgi:hypothetical protein
MDDPKKKKADSKRRSKQPHELAYQKRAKKASGLKKSAKKKSVKKKAV